MDKYTGKKLDGRYEIRELIGVGGMAYVYHCYDTIDDREVAIKILKDEYLNNKDFIRRFKNESKAIAMLSHPNIVKVLDVSFGDVIQYIVMEYIDGITLKEYITLKEVLDWHEAVHFIIQTLKALQHAHDNGIVHRDIKPQNIMLFQDGTIKVTDFGIARFSSNATRTMTQHAIGSVHYIAPEQAKGELTDGRADIYSIGVMLYEMLTGTVPFDSDNPVSVALMQLQNTPKRPRDINPSIPYGLEQITTKAMQKDKENRYQSSLHMLNDVERFRLNPNVVFSYKFFIDQSPTKHMTSSSTRRNERVEKPLPNGYGDGYSAEEKRQNRTQNFGEQSGKLKKSSYKTSVEEENKTEQKQVWSIVKACAISFAAMFLLFGILAFVNACNGGGATNKEVDVPNFVGKQFAEVTQGNGGEYNFEFVYDTDYDKAKSMGIVLKQDPEAGSIKVKEGSKITLTINGTETKVKIPDIITQKEAEAIKILQGRNLTPKVVYIQDDTAPLGKVASTFPASGVETNIGDTVFLFIPNTQSGATVEIPSLEGLSVNAAKNELDSLGLEYEISYDENSIKPKDEVVLQTPLSGGKVQKGYRVKLVLSKEKKIEREVTIPVPLPQNAPGTLFIKVFINGAASEVYSVEVDPAHTVPTPYLYNLTLVGADTNTKVLIQLNGQGYREYTVNFQTGRVDLTFSGQYVPPTEPPTEPPQTDPIDTPNPTDSDVGED
ncbi:MAG: Stk1 family PASTA domain-containing Ser/Thr kinase [Oscillospiraceae bacterium]|jgi:serine/threonine-protein kinase|nr:Stk1 family PASTA domain-containing Ser/Thr kinase [Oscillospiraceae bacterium]